jgi:hypothetical protein
VPDGQPYSGGGPSRCRITAWMWVASTLTNQAAAHRKKGCAGGGVLVGVDLGVGQACVVIDSAVDEVVANSSPGLNLCAQVELLRRAVYVYPPPGRIAPSFLTSTWTSSA